MRRHDCIGWYTGRRRRGRERRRPPGRLRRRLRRSERPGAELARRLPDEPRRRPRPALPERGNGPNGRARFREVGVQAGLEASELLATGSARRSSTSTATAGPISTSRTTRIRTSSTSTSRGRAARRPTRPGSASGSRTARAAAGVADPYAGMGVARRRDGRRPVRHATRAASRRPRSARTGASSFSNARADFDPALGTGFAGWGDSFVDLANSGTPDLVLATGGDPGHEPRQKDAGQVKVIAPVVADRRATGRRAGVVPAGCA